MPSIRPADAGDARRRQQLRADRCPALASRLVEPADVRLVIARSHRADPGSDGGQLGPPRSHLGQQAVRPRRRLATLAGGAGVVLRGVTGQLDRLAFDLLQPPVPFAQIARRRLDARP